MQSWETIKDAVRRKEARKMSNRELANNIAKIRKRLNRRMRELERSGFYEYSGSYERLVTYIRSDLGGYRNVLGQWEFTSKPYSKATRRQREELLVRWEHFLRYEGLTTESVKQQLQNEADKLNAATQSKNYDINKVMSIRDMMKDWRENLDNAIAEELFDSEFARKIYQENPSMNPTQRLLFLENMEKTFMMQSGDIRTVDPQMKPYFRVWLDNYNFNKNRSELTYGGIDFNPATGEIYDGITDYRMEIDTSTGNKVYFISRGNERINVDRDIGVENLYDFLFNNFE